MIPTRYLIASLFIAALLLLVAIVQWSRTPQGSRADGGEIPIAMALGDFEVLAEYPLEDGWSPRFLGAQDPDQHDPWPFEGGFGAPWEPASPYLEDQGLALNGPGGRSMVVLWRGLEWRRYRFDTPLVSARLDPAQGRRLLVTLKTGSSRYETRLLEVPEGRVLWATDSGPWSRFSWDGEAVLVGERTEEPEDHLLLSLLPVHGEAPDPVLTAWEPPGAPAGRKLPPLQDLFRAGRDYRGALLLTSSTPDLRLWLPREDRLWMTAGGRWSCWIRAGAVWKPEGQGEGVLSAQPPGAMGRVALEDKGGAARSRSRADHLEWMAVPEEAPPWPAQDPAWIWLDATRATTAWDLRLGLGVEDWPPERQRTSIRTAFRPEWRSAAALRASVIGWLPAGPEIALRESREVAWVWVGTRILLVRLQPSSRHGHIRKLLGIRG